MLVVRKNGSTYKRPLTEAEKRERATRKAKAQARELTVRMQEEKRKAAIERMKADPAMRDLLVVLGLCDECKGDDDDEL
jgi:hypothetical protein